MRSFRGFLTPAIAAPFPGYPFAPYKKTLPVMAGLPLDQVSGAAAA